MKTPFAKSRSELCGTAYKVFLRELDRTGAWADDYNLFDTGLNETEVRAVTVDADGRVWVAWKATSASTGGIRVFDTATQSFGNAEDFPDTDIRALELDVASRDMWVGTATGAYQHVFTSETWVTHTVVSDVQALASDDAGNVWFGTGVGLWRRTIDDTWSSYGANYNIVDVALDGDGNVWMALADAGLRVYLTGGEWLTYTTANSGLLTDTVTSLAVDGQGRIWVGYGMAAAGASVLSADRLIWFHVLPDEIGMEAVNVVVQSAAGDVWLGGAGAWGASSTLYHAYSAAAPNTTNGGHWGYVKLNSDASHLQHIVLEGGGRYRSPILYVDAAAPVLENLTIRGSGGPGLLAVDALNLTLYNVQTTSNVGDGIQLRGGDHYRVISATAQYNQGHGLRLEDAGHVVVTGTTLASNAWGYGVWSADNVTSLVFEDNTVMHNAYAARLPLAHQVGGNVWTGNRVNRIDVPGGELDVDSVWAAPLPYRIAGHVTVGANAPATLTLPPGADLLFAAQTGLYVHQNGTLRAMGTLTAPITLERADPNAPWRGVGVDVSVPRLAYVTVRGADTGLTLTLPPFEDVMADHLTLAGNEWGIGVSVGYQGSFTVRESNFIGNLYAGLTANTINGALDATHNYWNSPTGPHHDTLNPLGTGDHIAGTGVTQETFIPYLRRPAYLGSLSYDVVNLTPVDHTVLNFVEHNGVYTYTRAYPDGRQVVFDTEGRHLYTLEADGRATVYTYDSYDGLLATMGIVTPGGNLDAPTWVWSFGYNDDKLAYISYNYDTVATFYVNAQGNLEQVTFPDYSTRRFYYDERGLLTQQVDPLGQVTGYGYDQYGRLAHSIAPATTVYTPATGETAMFQTGRTFTPGDSQGLINAYAAPGTPAAPASAAPTSTLLVDAVTYADGSARSGHTNAWGQWTDQTDALGRTTVYTRDANNNLTGLVQPEGDCVVATYDAAGRPTYAARMGAEQCALPPEQRDPAQMQSTAFTYEARYGQVKTQTDALGQTTVYTYDYELDLGDAGKLAQIAYPPVQDEAGVWVTPVVSYTYNALRLLAEETARDGTVTRYTYTTGDEGECWWWEDEGTIPCFAPDVTPAPGLRAQVVRISGDTVLTTTYTAFDARGRAQTTIAPDGSRTHTLYDVMGRVISVTTDLFTIHNYYDANGNLITVTQIFNMNPPIAGLQQRQALATAPAPSGINPGFVEWAMYYMYIPPWGVKFYPGVTRFGIDSWLYHASYLPIVEDIYDWADAILLTGEYVDKSVEDLYTDIWWQAWLTLLRANFCGDIDLESTHLTLMVLAGIGRLEGGDSGAYAPGYIQNLEATDPRDVQGPDTTWHFFFHAFLSFEVLYSDLYKLPTKIHLVNGIATTAKLFKERVELIRQQYSEYGFESYSYLSEGNKAGEAYNVVVLAGDMYEVISTYMNEVDNGTWWDALWGDIEEFEGFLMTPDSIYSSGVRDPGVFNRDLRANRRGADFGVNAFYGIVSSPDPAPPYFPPPPR